MANNQQLLLGEGAGSTPAVYIEDVFSTYLYTGNGTSQTITNNIDLSTKGGMVWFKCRSNPTNHLIFDTVRGRARAISPPTTAGAGASSASNEDLVSFNATGFSLGIPANYDLNTSSRTYASWTFREQPKFFDVVTYTGTGSNTTIAHTLGAVPGCIIVKRTDTTADWAVYHRSLANTEYLVLNTTAAKATGATWWNSTTPTSSVFSVGTNASVNASGGTYVAYIYAHDAGGFGLAGTDNVISCGTASATVGTWSDVNVGFEPQWVLLKNSTAGGTYNPSGSAGSEDWFVIDTMRGATAATNSNTATVALSANSSIAEYNDVWFGLTSTGFSFKGVTSGSDSFIYIAIRRGPMKVPTVGTSVFSPTLATVAEGTGAILTTNFPIDLQVMNYTPGTSSNSGFLDRLRGIATTTTQSGQRLISSDTSAEAVASVTRSWDNTGFQVSSAFNNTRTIYWNFRRAPGFFDEVCWTGDNGANQRVSHNLGVAPELIIYKGRNKVNYWRVYFGDINKYIRLDAGIAAVSGSNFWGSSAPTTTDFGINCGSMDLDNFNAVGYLFATCAGVSKVGTYTGTAAAQVINCGFTSGARFVLIKRTDSTGDWYVWDSARGIIAGNDPYLLLNSTAAEVTSTDYIDTDTTGFEISSTAPAAINASAGTFIFWAVA